MDYQSHKMTDIKIKRNASPTQKTKVFLQIEQRSIQQLDYKQHNVTFSNFFTAAQKPNPQTFTRRTRRELREQDNKDMPKTRANPFGHSLV